MFLILKIRWCVRVCVEVHFLREVRREYFCIHSFSVSGMSIRLLRFMLWLINNAAQTFVSCSLHIHTHTHTHTHYIYMCLSRLPWAHWVLKDPKARGGFGGGYLRINGRKSRKREQCLHPNMIGYDWLWSAVIGSCNKSRLLCLCAFANQSEWTI